MFGAFIGSCSTEEIPEKVELSDEPRELAGLYCECMQKHDKNAMFCFREVKEPLNEAFQKNGGDSRKTFIKNLMHALVETECFEEGLDENVIKAISELESEKHE